MTFFLQRLVKDKFEELKTAFTNPTFLVFKIRIPLGRCAVKILEDLTEGNLRKSQAKS